MKLKKFSNGLKGADKIAIDDSLYTVHKQLLTSFLRRNNYVIDTDLIRKTTKQLFANFSISREAMNYFAFKSQKDVDKELSKWTTHLLTIALEEVKNAKAV